MLLLSMKTEDTIQDNRIHIRLKHHFVKHGKNIHAHIKKHHKKYLIWSMFYGVWHILILKVFAIKLLALKSVIGGLGFIGVINPSLTDIFAKMDNICIDNTPIIANQTCDKDFASIQDAVAYLEGMIDPETDTIYNAQYYGIVKSMLGEHCSQQIDQDAVDREVKNVYDIAKWKDTIKIIGLLEATHARWKEKSWKTTFSGELEFCNQRYLAYDILDLSKRLFLKELKKGGLLSPSPILSGQQLSKKSDIVVISSFAQRKQATDKTNISYILEDFSNSNAKDIATIIKNISLQASDQALTALADRHILTDKEKDTIKDKLELRFISSCEKNKGYHRIKQYYNNNNILTNTTLEEVKIDVWLCDSYQYIDQLDQQIKKLLLHEIGHYVYYFKDKSTNMFENICRDKNWKTAKKTCSSNEFVSNYSQTSADEDYAETFSRWGLTQMNTESNYLSYYRTTTVGTGWDSQWSARYRGVDNNLLSKKFNYFDSLLLKSATMRVM